MLKFTLIINILNWINNVSFWARFEDNSVFPWHMVLSTTANVSMTIALLFHYFMPKRQAVVQFFLTFPLCVVMLFSTYTREGDLAFSPTLLQKEILTMSTTLNFVFSLHAIGFTTFNENWSVAYIF